MEQKINIAEILKDCPKGMELDCLLYDNVTFERFDVEQNRCYFKAGPADTFWTTCYGKINGSPFGKCIIFPKGKTTWEGFVPPCEFNDGDIVATTNGLWIGITTGGEKGKFIPTYCVIQCDDKFAAYLDRKESWVFNRLATEEEKKILFDAIKENGYKWNPENNALEKLPKFKVGDKIRHKTNNEDIIYEISAVYDDFYGLVDYAFMLDMKYQDSYELVQNKFDITTLKPFESKVLVRDTVKEIWKPDFFGCLCDGDYCPYMVVGGIRWKYCIPYEGNERLLGTANDCDEYYKTWE